MQVKLVQRINGTVLRPLGFRLERTRPSQSELADANPVNCVPIEEVDHFQFRTNEWMYSAPVSLMIGRTIFGFGPDSWHPLVATSHQLLDNLDLPYESSILKAFYAIYTPASIADAYQLHNPGPLSRVSAQSYFEPWILSAPPYDDPSVLPTSPGNHLFGPLSYESGKAGLQRLRNQVKSIRKYGYQPELFPHGRIRVTVLRSQGRERYLVAHGQHRAAVLAAMGASRIAVGVRSARLPVVDEADAEYWPHVRSGFLTKSQAIEFLRRHFSIPEDDPALAIGNLVNQAISEEARARQ